MILKFWLTFRNLVYTIADWYWLEFLDSMNASKDFSALELELKMNERKRNLSSCILVELRYALFVKSGWLKVQNIQKQHTCAKQEAKNVWNLRKPLENIIESRNNQKMCCRWYIWKIPAKSSWI